MKLISVPGSRSYFWMKEFIFWMKEFIRCQTNQLGSYEDGVQLGSRPIWGNLDADTTEQTSGLPGLVSSINSLAPGRFEWNFL